MVHAQLLRRVVRDHLDDPAAFANAWHERTEAEVAPFYHDQMRADRARIAEMAALRTGRPVPPADPTTRRFLAAACHDPEVFRGWLETVLCLALPRDVLARPGMSERLDRHGDVIPPAVPGPGRLELLDLLADRSDASVRPRQRKQPA
jgi:hypothetical protein